MFDVGFWELLVIAVVLMLVMGPERLPEVAKQAAFLLRKARQGMYRLRSEMQGEIDQTPFADLSEARQEMSNFKNDMKQMGRDLANSHEELINAKPTMVEGASFTNPATVVAKAKATPNKKKVNKKSTSKKVTKKKATKKKTTSKKTVKKTTTSIKKKAGNAVTAKSNKTK